MAETAEARIHRLLSMVPWLMANSGVTVAQAATHFDVTPEKLIDDLRMLIVIGRDDFIDIQFWFDEDIADEDDDIPNDPAAVIKVVNPQSFDRPLRFSSDEVASISAQLQLLNAAYGHLSPAFSDVLEKFLVRHGINTPSLSEGIAGERKRTPLDCLREAIQTGMCADIRYASDSRDEVTDRTVQPVRITTVADLTYVEAWTCNSHDSTLKRYRIDRILGCRLSSEPPVDLAEVDTQPRAPYPDSGLSLRVRIHKGNQWLLEEHVFTNVSDASDGSVEATIVVGDSSDYAVRWGLQYAGFATVLKPSAIASEIQERARGALRAYAEGVTAER